MTSKKLILPCLVAAIGGLFALQTLVYNGFCVAKGGWSDEAVLYETAMRAMYVAYPWQSKHFRIPGVY